MTELRSISTLPINEFLDALGAKSPTPGGGAASGLTGAIGASLGAMVVRYTLGSKKYQEHDASNTKHLDSLESIRTLMLSASDEDASAYAALNALWTLDKDDPERIAHFDDAVRAAIAAPERIIILSEGLLQILDELVDHTKRTLRSDLSVSATLAHAVAHAAACNVRINIPMLPESEQANREDILAQTLARVDTISANVEERTR